MKKFIMKFMLGLSYLLIIVFALTINLFAWGENHVDRAKKLGIWEGPDGILLTKQEAVCLDAKLFDYLVMPEIRGVKSYTRRKFRESNINLTLIDKKYEALSDDMMRLSEKLYKERPVMAPFIAFEVNKIVNLEDNFSFIGGIGGYYDIFQYNIYLGLFDPSYDKGYNIQGKVGFKASWDPAGVRM